MTHRSLRQCVIKLYFLFKIAYIASNVQDTEEYNFFNIYIYVYINKYTYIYIHIYININIYIYNDWSRAFHHQGAPRDNPLLSFKCADFGALSEWFRAISPQGGATVQLCRRF